MQSDLQSAGFNHSPTPPDVVFTMFFVIIALIHIAIF